MEPVVAEQPLRFFMKLKPKCRRGLEAPACVWVSSGTLAGRLALAALGDDYQYHYMPNTHVAIHPFLIITPGFIERCRRRYVGFNFK